jgi:hypothetical protein
MFRPTSSAMRALDFGPWIWSGATSASRIVTSSCGYAVFTPRGKEQRVRGGQREPELVVLHPREHRVVDDPAVHVAHEHVLRLPHRALRQVPRREQLREGEAVRPRDLQAPLRHVPERHLVEERLVFVLERGVSHGDEHVVVHRVRLRP